MTPIKRTASVSQLAQMLRQLSALRATANQQMLVLKIWMGFDVNNLVQQSGLYRCADFNRLSERLGYKKQLNVLIDLIVKSGGFTVGLCARNDRNRYGVLWFASPLFFDERALEQTALARADAGTLPIEAVQMTNTEVEAMYYGGLWDFSNSINHKPSSINPQDSPQNTPNSGLYDSILNYTGANNIVLSGRRPLRPAAPSGNGGASSVEVNGSGLMVYGNHPDDDQSINHKPSPINPPKSFVMPSATIREQEVDRFIEEIRHSEVHGKIFVNLKLSLIKPMKNGIEQHNVEHFTDEQAREIIRVLMYDHVKPYFMEQQDFFRYTSITSRKAWLQNLLYSRFGQKLMAAARKTCKARWNRNKRRQEAETAINIRNNRPLSPHEWMEDNIRYYDDPDEGIISIPPDAPTRPSSSALWNKFSSAWE